MFLVNKDYTEEPYTFLVNKNIFHQIIHSDLGKTYYKMTVTEKINTIDNKIAQNKVQYSLDLQTVTISALSSGNVSKYEFLIGKKFYQKKTC